MNDTEINNIVSKLSKNLQEELQFQLRGNILRQFNLFNNNFSQHLLKKIAQLMEEVRFSPEELIFSVFFYFKATSRRR